MKWGQCKDPICYFSGNILVSYMGVADLNNCCDIGQIDRFSIIELNPSFVLSSDNTNCKNDIQLFHQLFDELSVHTDYH